MSKLRLLSAASAVAMGVAFSAPVQAFDNVHWKWYNTTHTHFDADFDINVDFIAWGLTQTERLQVMVGNMTAFADGSNASYTVLGENGGDAPSFGYRGGHHGGHGDDDEVAALDAVANLGKVDISATAISNIASIDSEHATLVHDGQIAFGDFYPLFGNDSVGVNSEGGYGDGDGFGSLSGNRNFDMALLAYGSAQFGLISKGTNTATAVGNDVSNAALAVDATAAANIHTVSVKSQLPAGYSGNAGLRSFGGGHHSSTPSIDSDNIAIVDLNQFAYQDINASATAINHSISGFTNMGTYSTPVLKVSASALGNVSTVTNKFGGAPAN